MKPVTAEARRLLDTVLLPRRPPFHANTIRLGHHASIALGGEPPAVAAIDGFVVPPDPARGTPALAVRRYRPRPIASAGRTAAVPGGSAMAPGSEAMAPGGDPAIVWLHGGGWVSGTLEGFDTFGRALANATGRQVLMVDYRLAPEAPYPAAIDDCCAAYTAIVARAAALGIDRQRIVAGGDSAGGHLAITMTRWLIAAGAAAPRALLLVYPVTDARLGTDSYGEFAEGYNLSAGLMAWFWQQFVPQGTRRDGKPLAAEHPDLSPVLAGDLARLPPALVMTAECDVLHDEGVAFADAMVRSGAVAEHVEFPGMIHGFIRFSIALPQAEAILATMRDWLARRGA
ncbi:MAG: alpha/beta hydrolase [Lautropia sp.]